MLFLNIFLLAQTSFAAPCLTSYRLCKERDQFLYHLQTDAADFKKACGINLKLNIDWKSFTSALDQNEVASMTTCQDLIKYLTSICEIDKNSIEKIKAVDSILCKAKNPQRQLSLIKNKLVYAADIEYGTKSDHPKPFNSEYLKEELKKVLKIEAIDSSDKERVAQKKQDLQREDESKKRELKNKNDQEQREKAQKAQAEKIAEQVKTQNQAAQTKTDRYLKKTQELQKWYQDELKKLMASKMDPNEKSQKMQDLGQKYQSELQSAIKEMQGGQ